MENKKPTVWDPNVDILGWEGKTFAYRLKDTGEIHELTDADVYIVEGRVFCGGWNEKKEETEEIEMKARIIQVGGKE